MRLENLEKLRKEKGFASQEKFAIHIGIDRTTYNGYVNGNPMPSDILKKIAKELDVSTDYILGLSDCRSVQNDYINKYLGLSDDAINGLREIVSDDSDKRLYDYDMRKKKGKDYKHVNIYNLSVINFMLSNHAQLKNLLEWFVTFAVPFLFGIPVMTDSKGNWKKIDTKKTRFGLASFECQPEENVYMPLDYMPVLIGTHARDMLSKALDDMAQRFSTYLMYSGVTDAITLLKYAMYKNAENTKL